jgi:hypothetical protein
MCFLSLSSLYPPTLSVSLQMTGFQLLWLNNIPLCIYNTFTLMLVHLGIKI